MMNSCRQKLAMKLIFLVATLMSCLFSGITNAGALFKDCEDIAGDSSYRLLQKYISTRDEGNELCQRLSDNEFLYTTNDNIYYCRAENGAALKCESNEIGRILPELSVIKKFTDGNGNQFVLFRTRSHLQDDYSESYLAFFLVPRNINPRGYMLFLFAGAGSSDNNDGSGRCANTGGNTVITPAKPAVEFINENQRNVSVRFNQLITNCKTAEKSKQTLEYTWQSGSFKQSKNQTEALKAEH